MAKRTKVTKRKQTFRRYHSNKKINIVKDDLKSYVYIRDGKKEIGMLCWDYRKRKWRFRKYG